MGDGSVVAVVGAGLVGSGWALVFARAGLETRVYDPQPEIREKLMPWMQQAVHDLANAGLVDNPKAVLEQITVVDTLRDALRGASYVQESAFETVEVKTAVSAEIDAEMDAGTLVGSSSSGIPASRFTEGCRNRSQFMIAHPVNPPHLIPLVELVPAPWTDPDAVTKTRALMELVGQVPVTVEREIDGFILNRLQGALLNEAWALYDEGYANLADIDATIAHGLGLRWSFMGPFETIDLNAPGGIVDYAERLGPMYHKMAADSSPKAWPDQTVLRAGAERRASLGQDALEERRTWRDQKLMQLTAFKKKAGLAV